MMNYILLITSFIWFPAIVFGVGKIINRLTQQKPAQRIRLKTKQRIVDHEFKEAMKEVDKFLKNDTNVH